MFLKKLMPIHTLYNWLMPSSCVLCGCLTHNNQNICQPCRLDLPILPHNCKQCARFLPFTSSTKCGACLKQIPPFDYTHALFPYEQTIRLVIAKLKFQHQLSYALALAELMINQIKTQWYIEKPLPQLIIPIPLHSKRLSERGFNQALEIAKPIAKKLNIPIDYQGVKRSKPTLAQSGLAAEKRKQNIAGAFSISQDYTGLTIAVLDDVITTGHTVVECCQMLKKHGATRIDVWCCARNG